MRFYPEYSPFVNSLLLVGIPLLKGKSLKELGFKNYKNGLIYGFGASVLILPLFYLLVYKFFGCSLKGGPYSSPADVFVFFLTVAVSEEVFFRGYFYSEMKNEPFFLFISKNNFVSSFLFGVAHALIYYNPAMFKVFFPSLIMGYLYEGSGSLIAPIIFHFFSDVTYYFCHSKF